MKRLYFLCILLILALFSTKQVHANVLFNDSFIDTDGTTLQSHGPYVRFGGLSATIQSNKLEFPDDFGHYYYTNTVPASDYKACFTIDQTFSNDPEDLASYTLIYFRGQSTPSLSGISSYRAYFQPNNDGTYAVELARFDGANPQGMPAEVLATTTTSAYSDGSHVLCGSAQGTTISATIDGSSILSDTDTGYLSGGYVSFYSYSSVYTNFNISDFASPTPTPTPSPTPTVLPVKIIASPSYGTRSLGVPFTIDVLLHSEGASFNAAQTIASVSANLTVNSLAKPTSGACNLNYTQTPTAANPSFAGALFGTSSKNCKVYTLTVTPNATGSGTLNFTNSLIKSYSGSSEILTGVQNALFQITSATPTPTPTPPTELTVVYPEVTYKSSLTVSGTKDAEILQVFINDSDEDSTYPTSTTWEAPVTLALGPNIFSLYGWDDEENVIGDQTFTINRHTLGDINGDGVVDLIDASLFAVDWDKTSGLTYVLSDMNDDGSVNLVDLSILAKLEAY